MRSTSSISGTSTGDIEVLRTLDQLESGFVALDREDRYTYVNATAAVLLGWDADELRGRHVWDVFPEGVGSAVHRAMTRARRTGETVIVEDYWESLGRWFEKRFHPHPGGLHISFADITARVELEQSLRGGAELVDRLGVGLAVLELDEHDETLRVRSTNAALERILDIAPGWLVGEKGAAGPALALGLALDDLCREVRRSGESVDLGERPWTGSRGMRSLRIRIAPMSGREVGVAVEDVTDYQQATGERLELAARLLRASEDERHALGTALMSGPIEALLASALRAGSAASTSSDPAAAAELAGIEREIRDSMSSLLELLGDRYPPQLDDQGLGAALSVLGTGAGVRIDVQGDVPAGADVIRDVAYRLVRDTVRSLEGADVLHVALHPDEAGGVHLTARAQGGRLRTRVPSAASEDWLRLLGGSVLDTDGMLVSVHLPGAP